MTAKSVVLMVHPERMDALKLLAELVTFLEGRQHMVRLPIKEASQIDRAELGFPEGDLAVGADLAVAIGGDGTMLRTFELAAPAGIPVLGIHAGHLGYLTEFEPANATRVVTAALDDEMHVEERMMVETSIVRADGIAEGPWCGLNEAVLEKSQQGHMVRLSVDLDGAHFATYSADGVVVATPTGSTAYNLSARGPIVAPLHRSLQLTAVAPHMLFDRSLVLAPETEVRLEVVGDRPASLSMDGRATAILGQGDAAVSTGSATVARLVTSGTRDFHQILKTKFGLKDS